MAIFCLLLSTNALFAQGPPPPGDGLDPGGAEVPVDGGISLLLAAGISYGTKKVIDARKKARATTEPADK
ncbi:hypothetical protein EXU57_06895 [Segetibacter sp. 3557_3]|nr:hypothetical protein EXU57_06895 [Segetibacter sp. 3557_3]